MNNIIHQHCWLPIYLGDFCHICKQSVAILSIITTVVGTSVRTKLLVVKHCKNGNFRRRLMFLHYIIMFAILCNTQISEINFRILILIQTVIVSLISWHWTFKLESKNPIAEFRIFCVKFISRLCVRIMSTEFVNLKYS